MGKKREFRNPFVKEHDFGDYKIVVRDHGDGYATVFTFKGEKLQNEEPMQDFEIPALLESMAWLQNNGGLNKYLDRP